MARIDLRLEIELIRMSSESSGMNLILISIKTVTGYLLFERVRA